MAIKVVTPESAEDFKRYYQLRWEVLRKPFNRPPGSEQDEYDQVGYHRMLVTDDDARQVVGVARLHFNTTAEAQIRFMAVHPDWQSQNLGVQLLKALELLARKEGAQWVIIRSRDTTRGFYEKCGYELKEEADTVTDPMAEHQLLKELSPAQYIVFRPRWCQALQRTWHQDIPISAAMGIEIYQYTGRTLELRAPVQRNINVHDTMFAGSIYTLATLCGWGLVQLQLQEQALSGPIVLADANIEYQRPIVNSPRAVVKLADMTGTLAELAAGRNARLTVPVTLLDGQRAAARFTGHYVVKAPRP